MLWIVMTSDTTIDLTSSLTLDAIYTWGTAAPANTTTITNAFVEILN